MEKRERGEHRGRLIMEGKDGRWKTIEAKEKTEPRKGGMRQAREGERWDRKEKESGERWDRKEKESGERQERRWENRVGGNKIIAAWLRRCGIK